MSLHGHFQNLAQSLRIDRSRIELDQIVFHPPGEAPVAVALPAAIEVVAEHLHLDLRIPDGAQFPSVLDPLTVLGRGGPTLITASDCYRISARTSDGVAVVLEGVGPVPNQTSNSSHSRRCRLGFSHISLPGEGFDLCDFSQLHAILDALPGLVAPQSVPPPACAPEPRTIPEEQLFAILPRIKLRIRNDGTDTVVRHPFLGELKSSKANAFVGQVDGGMFCLHEEDSGDLVVYYRREIGKAGARRDTSKVFDGILDAVGYTHGCHPHPLYREHRCDHRLIERWMTPRADIQGQGLLPLSEGVMHHSEDAQALFIAAAEFFASDSEAAQRHSRTQWLLREACPEDLAFEIRLMALCVLFEGLLRELETRYLTMSEQKPHKEGGLTRREKWKQSLERHGLPWTGAFELVYQSWDFYRSPLAHGFQERSGDDAGTTFNAYSRLTAALHILLAREAGYVGPLGRSILEGDEKVVLTMPRS